MNEVVESVDKVIDTPFKLFNEPKDIRPSFGTPVFTEIGFADAGARARAIEKLGQSRNYHVLFDNCHQFISGCLTGDFGDLCNFLRVLKDEVQRRYGDQVVWKNEIGKSKSTTIILLLDYK
ncbi:hypothetical protein BAU22_22410 [Bacillus sp. 4048]|uniref:hypothetical protein n=1 Tax=Bacillus TaxID=1386 RepID=UPI0008FE2952|nr:MULTISPECIES: hypothetical protein [Bacillus]OJD42613.1 hypothetical protein BAU22_22410 [Bacillus sp. 4048]TCD35116.1 hypothetical protein E0D84_01270 [Bacillus wiedmannii]